MSYEAFRRRMNSYGGDIQKATSNISKISAVNQIMYSPNRKTVNIDTLDSKDEYCIVQDIDHMKIRKFLFLPDTNIQRGNYIHHEGYIYLATEQYTTEEYPQVNAEICTADFAYELDRQDAIIGYDNLGRPIYPPDDSLSITLPCIVKFNDASTAIADANEPINLLDNIITVTIPYGKINNIKYDSVFPIFGDDYRVIRIDPSQSIDGVGLLKITGQRLEYSE